MTRAGVYLGSLLISTPGGALRPGSQAGLRRLIVGPDRVSAGGLAKDLPTQVAFSLTGGDSSPLRVVARAGGRSSVRVVTRTAGVKLSRSGSLWLYSYCTGNSLNLLERDWHIAVPVWHCLEFVFERFKLFYQNLNIIF